MYFFSVERGQRLAVFREPRAQIALQFRRVEDMQRAPAIQRKEIGDVDQGRDRAQAHGLQPVLQPGGRRAVLHATDQPAREHRRCVLLNRCFDWRGEFARHRRQIAFAQTPKSRRRQIARDTVDAGRIAAIGRDGNVDDGIVEAERVRHRRADCRVGRKFDDAFGILRQQKLAARAQHAARFDAANGADFQRLAADRNDDAGPREHSLHSRMGHWARRKRPECLIPFPHRPCRASACRHWDVSRPRRHGRRRNLLSARPRLPPTPLRDRWR